MWALLGIIFLIVAIVLLDCIRKPPKVKEGQKPLTKRDYIIGASVCGVLSLVFFGMNDSAFIWNLISIISFIGIFVFFIWAIVSLFKRNGTAKKKFMYTGVCFVAFLIGAVNSPPNEQPQNISTSKETSTPVVAQKSSENEEAKKKAEQEAKKKEAEALAAKRAAEEKEKQEVAIKKAEQEAKTNTESQPTQQQSTSTPIISEEPTISNEIKELTQYEIKRKKEVTDAYIDVKDTKIILALTVRPGTSKEKAKELGDDFVRSLGGLVAAMNSNLSGPTKDNLGELWNYYDVHIGVGTGPDNFIAEGYKVTTSPKISW
ncbi:hypothetical protein [Aneurinibacillus aneurinilyticus]|uniref:hypothetical protein n=1 Tax=Aneurinibacillus aneurinilyticus TaxID=1391 RepID=UPI00040B9927|nr:hypothetical protein [Aneurinibacillus aneurinilyticus]MED0704885.1 hypothetical protein [Aneurinibacillus aneurinilyticus]MED0724073.1 hypothetical protein [Aneurinibacillus aneurinilyticus]MED0731930.1 hypothetical protein [Aneurinibacillus aneurinilyticus]MED0741540.1 hypothetical protein [Aneurinibacillus aneurinilyticus]